MTSLESILHCLKKLSINSKFNVETTIPSLDHWDHWSSAYRSLFKMCNGVGYNESIITGGYPDNKLGIVIWGFSNKDDQKKFRKMCVKIEGLGENTTIVTTIKVKDKVKKAVKTKAKS